MGQHTIDEWKNLRAEIARKQSFAEKILVTVGGLNFAIIGFGIRDHNVEGIVICLLPTVISSVMHLWLLAYIFSIFRIASYIKNEIEPVLDINWEQWLSNNSGKFKFKIKNIFSFLTNTLSILSLCAALLKTFLLYSGPMPPSYPLLIAILSVVAFWTVWKFVMHCFLISEAEKDISIIHREIRLDV